MKLKSTILAGALCAAAFATPAAAQMVALNDPVVAAPDPEALFTSRDPKLHRNKQAALAIVKHLLQCDQWDRSAEWLTDRYIQHNPIAKSGRQGVVDYFVNVAKRQPKSDCPTLKTPIVSVQAEGDFVTVMFVRELPSPADPTKTYTTTWFDTWRFVDGKADEHWDPATLPTAPPSPVGSVDLALQQAADRDAIEQLMWRYDRALDRFEPEAYAAVFTPDGTFGEIKGREGLHKMVADMRQSRADRRAKGEAVADLFHASSNHWIEFVSPDRALIHYYWQTYYGATSPESGARLAAAGNGLDEVVKVGGKWLYRTRNIAPKGE